MLKPSHFFDACTVIGFFTLVFYIIPYLTRMAAELFVLMLQMWLDCDILRRGKLAFYIRDIPSCVELQTITSVDGTKFRRVWYRFFWRVDDVRE